MLRLTDTSARTRAGLFSPIFGLITYICLEANILLNRDRTWIYEYIVVSSHKNTIYISCTSMMVNATMGCKNRIDVNIIYSLKQSNDFF